MPEQKFTDADLRRLKEGMNAWWCENITANKMKALLARMKAAELALTDTHPCPCEKGHFHLLKDARYEAWRRASGK